MGESFTWRDGDRVIRFGRGAVADASDLLGSGFALVTTERALAAAPQVADLAGTVHVVGPGRVDELAGDLLADVHADLIVGLGGGRVIDTAKALAAASGPATRAAAIPTTLSAAEMTWLHRQASGADPASGFRRAAIVLNDPALSASQPVEALAASAANALGHAVEGVCTTAASPVPTLAAREAARLLAAGLPAAGEPDRDALALGALLAGWSIDASWYGLHHVLSQTLVRFAGAGHGPANAVMLQVTTPALRERAPEALAALDAAAGEPAEAIAGRLALLAGARTLRAIGVEESALERCADEAAGRRELDLTPPRATRDQLLAYYREAW